LGEGGGELVEGGVAAEQELGEGALEEGKDGEREGERERGG
jgi:hypothetical protein